MSIKTKPDYLEEVIKPYNSRTAMEEASRCLLCHDAPCSKACPASTDPAKFIRSLRFRNIKGAAETIRSANPLGGICARVCPYDKLCEEACSRCGIDKPIQIGRLQSFATDQETLFNMKIMEAPAEKIGKAACIGAGPASLTCAAVLAQNGVEVTIFEKKSKAGGLMTYGIIPSRLPNEVVEQEIKHIEDLGVKFVFNTTVGKDITLEQLKEQGFQAFFIGIGLCKPKMPELPGIELDGVTNALTFLAEAKEERGNINPGENVIVIGGGDVAMDAAATARLLGANVTVVYRRTLEEAPANINEIEFTQSLGVAFSFRFRPKEILGENGKVTAFRAEGTDGVSELLLKADKVIFAIGQENDCVDTFPGVVLNEKSLIIVDNGVTSVPGIFAAGDVVNGGQTVVQAVAEAKAAALKMLQYIGGAK
ncbi:MAG: FAD-dependent oxidoreductase [Acetivibrionales bacterium]|jgi:dihydropyrimidine dehydrogenase (NAD+) subunit PreT